MIGSNVAACGGCGGLSITNSPSMIPAPAPVYVAPQTVTQVGAIPQPAPTYVTQSAGCGCRRWRVLALLAVVYLIARR